MKVHELYAYIAVANAPKAIEFYTRAFDAKEKFRLVEPSGRVGHAELDFGGTTLMLSDEYPEIGLRAPAPQSVSVSLMLPVLDTDAALERATAAGASGSEWIFRGMAVGAAVKILLSLAFLLPSEMSAAIPVLPKAELASRHSARRCLRLSGPEARAELPQCLQPGWGKRDDSGARSRSASRRTRYALRRHWHSPRRLPTHWPASECRKSSRSSHRARGPAAMWG